LEVVVAFAGFPKYGRNLNTGGDNERDTRYIVARQRILHDTFVVRAAADYSSLRRISVS
jgi:predicted acyl esterase